MHHVNPYTHYTRYQRWLYEENLDFYSLIKFIGFVLLCVILWATARVTLPIVIASAITYFVIMHTKIGWIGAIITFIITLVVCGKGLGITIHDQHERDYHGIVESSRLIYANNYSQAKDKWNHMTTQQKHPEGKEYTMFYYTKRNHSLLSGHFLKNEKYIVAEGTNDNNTHPDNRLYSMDNVSYYNWQKFFKEQNDIDGTTESVTKDIMAHILHHPINCIQLE